jgi:hypothetical protein
MPMCTRLTAFPIRSAKRQALLLALAVVSATVSGCAVGNVGTVAAHVQRGPTVSIVSVYSIGLHLRTQADDAGAHLGFSRRTHVFAADNELQPGWHFLRVPSPAHRAIAHDVTTLGLDLSTGMPAPGIALGYHRSRLLASVPADACVRIDYAGADLRIARIQHCSEVLPCHAP